MSANHAGAAQKVRSQAALKPPIASMIGAKLSAVTRRA
jgi:hypothetical protein